MPNFSQHDLLAAFNECARIHGKDAALETFAKATGYRDLASVKTHDMMLKAMTALVGGRCLLEGMLQSRSGRRRSGRSRWMS
jgi:hypothetical protein